MIPALEQAALDPAITGRTMQVYVYLLSQLDVCQFRAIKIRSTARTMRLERALLSLAVTTLVERGYLEAKRDGNDLRRRAFRLVFSVSSMTRNRAA